MHFGVAVRTILGCLAILAMQGCEQHTSTAPPVPVDAIAIVSVDPRSSLPPDSILAFTVRITYTLATLDSAVLMVGFNNGATVNSFRMVASGDTIVTRGSGSHAFRVAAKTKYWDTQGAFAAYVNISPYPHGSSWRPLATARFDCTVVPRAIIAARIGGVARGNGKASEMSCRSYEAVQQGRTAKGPAQLMTAMDWYCEDLRLTSCCSGGRRPPLPRAGGPSEGDGHH
jgi:hypothetical protein